MICSGCGAHLIDGTKKCPFCREILGENGKSNVDVTYKIESRKQLELIKNSAKTSVSPQKVSDRRKKKRYKKMAGYAVLLGVFAILLSIVIGIVSFVIYLFSDNVEYTVSYYAANELGLRFDDESVVLTKEFFKEKSEAVNSIPEDVIAKSADGNLTAFIDKYDKYKRQGRLSVISESDKNDIVVIAENVSPGFKVSDDGEYIFFIKNANNKGNMGELWIYRIGEDAVKISDKVDSDKVIFSEDSERVIYIKNYNYKKRCGTAYYADFSDWSEHKIDSDVHMVYSSFEDNDKILYSKEYKKDAYVYDIYVYDCGEIKLLARDCGESPKLCADKEYAFLCADKSGDRYSLYRVDADEFNIQKIVNNMSNICEISENGEKVVYSKQFDNNVADYYIWTEGEVEKKVADGVNYTLENQVAISDDYTVIAYVSNFDDEKNGGALYRCEYDNGIVTEAEKISEDVFNCFIFNDDMIVYSKNFSTKTQNAGLYIYDGNHTEINPEINPEYLAVKDKIFCLYDYSKNNGGNLYEIDDELTETKITTDVFDYYIKENGEIVIARSRNLQNGKFDIYETCEGDVVLIKKDAEKILFY